VSLLDSVVDEVGGVKKNLPAADRSRLDQYLNDVREIERRIQKAGEQLSEDIKLPAAPVGIPADFEDHLKLMFDLQVLACRRMSPRPPCSWPKNSAARSTARAVCATRSTRSHHSNMKENTTLRGSEPLPRDALTYLLDKRRTPDGDGSLPITDRSLRQCDGRRQPAQSHPLLPLAGALPKAAGWTHTATPKTTMSNLLLAILDKFDVHQEKFGTAPDDDNLRELTADYADFTDSITGGKRWLLH
jgi:hypothetical protein